MPRIQSISGGSTGGSTLSKASVNEYNTGTDDTKYITSLAKSGSDGWQSANDTWTYYNATGITVASGAASKYRKGDKIKLTQHSVVKYFYITIVADTLLTVTAGTDNTVEDTATYPITLNYYSHSASPLGFPDWFAYTPTFTCSGSLTFESVTVEYSKFSIVGNTLFYKTRVYGTLGGTASNQIFQTLPVVAADSLSLYAANCSLYIGDWILGFGVGDGTTGKISCKKTDASNYATTGTLYIALSVVVGI